MSLRDKTSEREKINLVESMAIALSMYSRIPMPKAAWSKGGMQYVFCFFPVAGVIVGAVMTGFFWLSGVIKLGVLAVSCIGTALPLFITGGIHMDGFLDTVDARSSCLDRERKLEILKDPHKGAFALWGGIVYFMLYAAALSELGKHAFPAGASIYVITRALSGLSVVTFPKARTSGLARAFADGAKEGGRVVKLSLSAWFFAGVIWTFCWGGAVMAAVFFAVSLLTFYLYWRMALGEFGGVTGDLAGFFLQVSEFLLTAALAVCTRIV